MIETPNDKHLNNIIVQTHLGYGKEDPLVLNTFVG